MTKRWSTYKRKVTRRRTVVGLLSILMVVMLVAVACGEDATATPVPATSTPVVVVVTATPEPAAVLRPISEWTVDNPGTLAEVEAALEKHRGEDLVWVSWGGAYQGSQRQGYILEFADKFGINVIEDTFPTNAKVRAQAETGNITWHVFDTGTASATPLGLSGDLEELDFSIVDTRDWLEVARSPWAGGGGITWSTNYAFSTTKWPDGGPQPSSPADFFDVEKFPGRRAMGGPEWAWNVNLRLALIGKHPELLETAEGRASLTSLSDAQVDEAFEILEEFNPNIDIWWANPADCAAFLLAGEVDFCTAPAGRFYDAIRQGSPLKLCWSCGFVLETEGWQIIKGLKAQDPEKFELAQLLLAWVAFPEINAQIAKFINYGPVNLKSLPLLDTPEYAASKGQLPSSPGNLDFALILDQAADAVIYGDVAERWLAFQLGE